MPEAGGLSAEAEAAVGDVMGPIILLSGPEPCAGSSVLHKTADYFSPIVVRETHPLPCAIGASGRSGDLGAPQRVGVKFVGEDLICAVPRVSQHTRSRAVVIHPVLVVVFADHQARTFAICGVPIGKHVPGCIHALSQPCAVPRVGRASSLTGGRSGGIGQLPLFAIGESDIK